MWTGPAADRYLRTTPFSVRTRYPLLPYRRRLLAAAPSTAGWLTLLLVCLHLREVMLPLVVLLVAMRKVGRMTAMTRGVP